MLIFYSGKRDGVVVPTNGRIETVAADSEAD
jgi:hypothetical protein